MALWLVRGGRYGEHENLALQNGITTIGWTEVPDLAQYPTREALDAALQGIFPDGKSRAVGASVSQLWAFAHTIQKGDLIALPLKKRAMVAFGEVTGNYEYKSGLADTPIHTRPVKWLSEIPRGRIDSDLRASLSALRTVCQISRNNAENRIRALLQGRSAPPPQAIYPDAAGEAPEQDFDLVASARDRIRDHITRKFSGHAMAALVEALLQAQGFHTELSPPGPDGGIDIIAGRGPFGFEEPRMIVQVKSGDGMIDIKPVRELQGVMKNYSATHGLFVAWGGYRNSVEKEAARLFFEIRLWDSDDVMNLIETHYDRLPDDIRADLPLRRIWTLAQPDTEADRAIAG